MATIDAKFLTLMGKIAAGVATGAALLGGGTYGYNALGDIQQKQTEHEVRLQSSEQTLNKATGLIESMVGRVARIETSQPHIVEKIDRNHSEVMREISRVGKIATEIDTRLRHHEVTDGRDDP